ncbi:4-hydroxyphenylacetate 3-monooxygenase, oxygenase component [Psychrobacillus psychrodurans]|uniref:4-hydroxyphenylacetate 3-monooxygenase, oxygenase component n=1 Tax=Psychrobacillus psychrodurans TaxID=126157 RepID=UPI0008E9D9C5|nr:4-hydroxyphenylacetate 3-monooxygenase, oxygenase component [Psychrobacillus psychrodurans]MCZ8539627.1 4-hydroxyphenylacetate 3-monooxygenase, oxygenase component [Psychrobacillus psychrodurans]SFM43164.1 4-hydroxyphenylacetate 3-monooxygenase [Psychrobacillus psychrodurans]
MPAITGKQYINRIDQLKADVWIDGKPVSGNISEHPAFKGIIKSQARLYDLQHDKDLKNVLTYLSPTTKKWVGMSYLQPKTKEDLVARREMVQQWAKSNNGLMGRSPDYMNTVLMALASSVHLLADQKNCFPDNLQSFYEYARENDISMTHTFIEPQVNRTQLYVERSDEPIAAKIVGKNKDGIIIKGARLLATQGGITDELLVIAAGGKAEEGNSFAFSIPCNTKGLRFIGRESFVGGDSNFNYPLSSKYEEIDSIVVFDDVLVPWERVFYYDNLFISTNFMKSSSFLPFTLHQVASRQIVKTEFILGIVQSIIETINIEEYQHVQEKATEIIIALETMKALVIKSEVEAKVDKGGWMQPDSTTLQIAMNVFPRIYPRFSEIIQLLGASGLMSIPTESAFQSPIRNELNHYLQSWEDIGKDRVKLFRLAWDLTMSAFGTRQTLYERFFFGDPVRLASQLYFSYDTEEYVQRVKDILKQ